MARELEFNMTLGASLTSGFRGSMTAAQARIRGLGQAVRTMESSDTGKLGARLDAQRNKIESLSRSLHDEKKALADMRAQADAAGGAHGVLAQQIRQSERRVEQLRNSLRTAARAQADNVVQATRQSGSLSRLRAEYRGLASEIDRTRRHQERLSRIMAAQERERAHRSNLMGRGLATAAAAGTLAVPVKMAISAEDTFADLKKVLPDMTDEAVEQIFQDALALSAKTGKSFEDVVAIMTAGAQAGLGKTREEMLAVTEQSLQMAVAWGVGADEAGKSLATWQASMKLTSAESKRLADTINVLSDNMNAEAGEINRIVTRMGPLLKEIGFSTSGIAAYGAAFKAAGADVEVCGTALKNMTKVMSAGSAGLTKERRGIYAQLRIDPDTLAKQMQQDAEGATLMVLEALKRVAPEERMGLATRLFGDESIGAIAPLLGNIDLLKDALVTAQGEVDGSVWKEYQNRMSTTASAGNRLLAKLRGLSIETGKRLLPATKKTFDALGRGVDVIRGLARDYPSPGVCFRHGQGPVHKVLRRRRPGQHGGRFHARFNHGRGQIGSRRLPGNAEKLFVRAVAIGFDKIGTPCRFCLRRPGLFRHPADTAVQTGGKRVVQRDAVKTVRKVPGPHVLDKFIERVVRSVMRRNDDDLPAPHEQSKRGFEQLRQVFHKGCFVYDDAALFAAQVGGAIGERENLVPAGEVDTERLDFPLVPVPENILVHLSGHDLQLFRPFRAGVDIFPRHVLVERNIPHVHTVTPGRGGFQHVVQRLRPGQTDTAGFFHHLDRRFVPQPRFLIRQQHVAQIHNVS